MISLIKRFIQWLKKLFKRKGATNVEPSGQDGDVLPTSNPPINTIDGLERQRYSANNFLHFGLKDGAYPEGLDIEGAVDLLQIFGTESYAIGLENIDDSRAYEPPLLPKNVHLCDFCGRPLTGSEYQVLKDGRERCASCSRDVVRAPEDIKNLFREVRHRMEQFFGIVFENEIGVSVVSAKKLAKGSFRATAGFDARAVGYVEVKRGRQTMVLENGAPRLNFMSTCAHELTHVWQNQIPYFQKLYAAAASGAIPQEIMLQIVEGHATWTEVQYLFLIGEQEKALFAMDGFLRRDDEYGRGFRLYKEKYGFTKGPVIIRDTPFDHPENPLAD